MGKILTDGVLLVEPLVANGAKEWLAGEDKPQLRWFAESSTPVVNRSVANLVVQSCRVGFPT